MPFNWKPTKFFNGTAQLLDKESAQELIQQLGKKYRINLNLGFKTPGFKYFKMINSGDLETVKTYPHLVTQNYGINPLWCLWLANIEGIHYSLYVNLVTEQVIWSKYRFSPELYSGTLFEGEIVGDKFVIWDVLVSNNRPIVDSMNLRMRIDLMRGLLDHHYVSDNLIENLPIKLKTYVTYPFLKSFVADHLINDPDNQGLLFVPNERSVKCFSLLFNGHHRIDDLPGFLNSLDPEDLKPQNLPQWDIGEMIHPTNKDEMVQDFWLSPVMIEYNSCKESFQLPDNYYQYNWRNYKLSRVGLILLRNKEKALAIKRDFEENEGSMKNGMKHLLKYRCEYVPRFRKWEPIELVET